tara:strand:- start:902 stop:1483 length:582 start_codon:yes stop_codon:yes gene_type:complete
MGFKRKLYPTARGLDASSRTSHSNEIDLRTEFDDLILGGATSIPHGRKALIRKMRRDSDNNLTACSCVDSSTGEPDTEAECSFCLGEGFYWDEVWTVVYSTYVGADGGMANRVRALTPGSLRVDYKVFYMKYDTDISYQDKIVELRLDSEGDPVVPYNREAIYKPQTIVEYRSDRGRTEYLAIYCREQDAIRR